MPTVLATGYLVALVRMGVHRADQAAPRLAARSRRLGTHVDLSHLAATPPGSRSRCATRLAAVEGRKLVFEVSRPRRPATRSARDATSATRSLAERFDAKDRREAPSERLALRHGLLRRALALAFVVAPAAVAAAGTAPSVDCGRTRSRPSSFRRKRARHARADPQGRALPLREGRRDLQQPRGPAAEAEARLLSRVHGEDARRAHARRAAHRHRAAAASSTTPTTTTSTFRRIRE